MPRHRPKPDLSLLPEHIRQVNKMWFFDSKTSRWIKSVHIANHIPKEPEPITELQDETIRSKRWDLNRD